MFGRRHSGLAGTALAVALTVPATFAGAQAPPSPSPAPAARGDQNAAIVKPLVEIGRVRSRTPYCGALARARAAIDSAVTFEYSTAIIAGDLQHFRLDSQLAKYKSLKKTEHDLTGLWDLAVAGRDDVRALRTAANADGVDEEKRKEMLAFADALDGAKARQMQLARALARFVGALAEQPVSDIVHNEAGDNTGDPLALKFNKVRPNVEDEAGPVTRAPITIPDPKTELLKNQEQTQRLFGAFGAERVIRDDLKDASEHGTKAMKLGACDTP